MKHCRIISFKTIPNRFIENHKNTFIQYTDSLQKAAQKKKGFLATEHFWMYDMNNIYPEKTMLVSISTWKTRQHWIDWFESKERESIHKDFKFIGKEEKFYKLQSRKKNDNFFLL